MRPRILGGIIFDPTPAQNGTQAPSSSLAPPQLRLLSNSSAEYLRGSLSTQVIPIIYILVVVIGIPANIAILFTVASKVRKVSSAILYCSLAVSDLLLLVSLLFKVHYHLYGNNWVLGETACRVVTACFYGNLYCSAQTLACVSVKRYLAVVHPFFYKRLSKRTCATLVSVVVWGIFVVGIIPELFVRQTFRLPEVGGITTCHEVLPLESTPHKFLFYYYLFLTIFGLLVPLVVSVVCYARIIHALNQSQHDWAMYIKASSLVFVIFLVCFTPAGVLKLVHYVQLSVDGTYSLHVYLQVAMCLCCLHACLDPFLFLFMSKSAGSRVYFKPFKGKSLSISF